MDNEIIVLTFTKDEIRRLVIGTGMKITNNDSLQAAVKIALGAFMSNIKEWLYIWGDYMKEIVKELQEYCVEYINFTESFGNECAYTDSLVEKIINKAEDLKNKYSKEV